MVAGLKFLSKKGFNPQNTANRKRVWEAEQEQKNEEKRIKERQRQLTQERNDEELARARGDSIKINFLYAPPPGMESANEGRKQKASDGQCLESSNGSQTASHHLIERQPGDDDAAAAFRQMLAAGSAASNESGRVDDGIVKQQQTGFGTLLQGTTVEVSGDKKAQDIAKANLTALEKAVGRKKDGQALTLDEQIQRFPVLANAPRAKGMTATDVGVSFKPLGTQIKNVKCLACGVWGHSRGDRECKLSGWDPFAAPTDQRPATSLIRRQDDEMKATKNRRQGRDREDESDFDSSSSESESSADRKRKRHKSKRRHRESSKRHHRHESSSSKHSRRSRSDSLDQSDSRRKRKKSHKRRRKGSR